MNTVIVNDSSKPQQYSISYLRSGRIKDIETGKFKITGYADNGSIQGEYVEKRGITPTTQWNRKQHDAYRNGTTLISTILCNARFTFPKSLYAVKDCLQLFVINKPNALIVDFFAGSGTTQHAVSLLNAEDGGKRRCIMVTNNEIGESDEKRFAVENYGNERLVKWDKPPTAQNAHFQIDYDTEEFLEFKDFYGIAKYVTWPRTVCSIEGHDIEGNPLDGNYLGSDIPMADGFNANVKYFKCDWTPRKPEDYLLSNALCLHIKELIELCTAEEVDGEITALIKSLKDEIIYIGKEFADIVDIFGEHLYGLNHEKFDYSDIGSRLSEQRNNFAHGNLDKDFIGASLLDVIFMEYVVYAMQLKYFGVEKDMIQKAINDLFHLSIAL